MAPTAPACSPAGPKRGRGRNSPPVTGASIGSLLAPFAFLGPRYDEEVRKTFTQISAADIFEDRKTRDSLFDDWPLKRQVEMRVTAQPVADVAADTRAADACSWSPRTSTPDAAWSGTWERSPRAATTRRSSCSATFCVHRAASPDFSPPVGIEVEANGKKFEELHSDGTITAPFFVVPELMIAAGSTSRPPLDQLYVIVNSRLGHDFSMPDRSGHGVLGRSIAVALTSAMRLQLLLISGGAQRHGFGLRIARVADSFSYPQRGVFDGAYMRALYEHGVASGKKGTAFEDGSTVLSQRASTTAQ